MSTNTRWTRRASWLGSLLMVVVAGCHEGGKQTQTTGGPGRVGEVRSIGLRLRGTYKEAGVILKGSNGKNYPGLIDPATGKVVVNAPRSVTGVLVARIKKTENAVLKDTLTRMVFPRLNFQGLSASEVKKLKNEIAVDMGLPADSFKPGAAKEDAATTASLSDVTAVIPASGFISDADLGPLDLTNAPPVALIGLEPEQRSVYEYIDQDRDGLVDVVDADDDGDGTIDSKDNDYARPVTWFDPKKADAWSVPDDAMCDMSKSTPCRPKDFFDEAGCAAGGALAEEYCLYSGDPGYYSGTISWFSCYSQCAKLCQSDAACGQSCVRERCLSGPVEPPRKPDSDVVGGADVVTPTDDVTDSPPDEGPVPTDEGPPPLDEGPPLPDEGPPPPDEGAPTDDTQTADDAGTETEIVPISCPECLNVCTSVEVCPPECAFVCQDKDCEALCDKLYANDLGLANACKSKTCVPN